MKITILGSGGAGGVPTVAWGWGRCNPQNPRNRRRRPSIMVEAEDMEEGPTRILVDASPDLREQLLDADTRTLTAVLFTHAHADHIHGLDDLREVNRALKGPLDIWADQETLTVLQKRFGYAFDGLKPGEQIYRPWLVPHTIDGPFEISDLPIDPVKQDHGYMSTLGFRMASFAYSTDLRDLPDNSKAALQDLDLWIVGALTDKDDHETHVSLTRALAWIEDLKPKRAVITHMGPTLDYDAVAARCPDNVEPAYDGMVLEV